MPGIGATDGGSKIPEMDAKVIFRDKVEKKLNSGYHRVENREGGSEFIREKTSHFALRILKGIAAVFVTRGLILISEKGRNLFQGRKTYVIRNDIADYAKHQSKAPDKNFTKVENNTPNSPSKAQGAAISSPIHSKEEFSSEDESNSFENTSSEASIADFSESSYISDEDESSTLRDTSSESSITDSFEFSYISGEDESNKLGDTSSESSITDSSESSYITDDESSLNLGEGDALFTPKAEDLGAKGDALDNEQQPFAEQKQPIAEQTALRPLPKETEQAFLRPLRSLSQQPEAPIPPPRAPKISAENKSQPLAEQKQPIAEQPALRSLPKEPEQAALRPLRPLSQQPEAPIPPPRAPKISRENKPQPQNESLEAQLKNAQITSQQAAKTFHPEKKDQDKDFAHMAVEARRNVIAGEDSWDEEEDENNKIAQNQNLHQAPANEPIEKPKAEKKGQLPPPPPPTPPRPAAIKKPEAANLNELINKKKENLKHAEIKEKEIEEEPESLKNQLENAFGMIGKNKNDNVENNKIDTNAIGAGADDDEWNDDNWEKENNI